MYAQLGGRSTALFSHSNQHNHYNVTTNVQRWFPTGASRAVAKHTRKERRGEQRGGKGGEERDERRGRGEKYNEDADGC